MKITCKLPNKSGGACGRIAIAIIQDGDTHTPACHFHTHRAGMANVASLDIVREWVMKQSALDLSQAVMKYLTYFPVEDRAAIAASVLEAYILISEEGEDAA